MAKRNLTLYVESELIELAKKTGINLSQEVNDFIKMRVMNMISGRNPTEQMEQDLKKQRDDLKDRLLIVEKELGIVQSQFQQIKDEKLKKNLEEAFR